MNSHKLRGAIIKLTNANEATNYSIGSKWFLFFFLFPPENWWFWPCGKIVHAKWKALYYVWNSKLHFPVSMLMIVKNLCEEALRLLVTSKLWLKWSKSQRMEQTCCFHQAKLMRVTGEKEKMAAKVLNWSPYIKIHQHCRPCAHQ